MQRKGTLIVLSAALALLLGGGAVALTGADADAAAAKRPLRAGVLGAAAQYIGIDARQLRTELRGRSLAQVATAHGKSVEGLQAAVVAAVKSRLDRAVAAGRITAAQAQQRLARLQANVARLVNHVWNIRSGPRAARQVALQAAARYLGLTRPQLRQQLPGHSLAELARARGKSVEGLQAAILAPAKARLDRGVAAGRITAAQRDQRVARLQALISRFVTHVF